MEFVKIAHPLVAGEGECAVSALPLWQGLGWHVVEHEPDVIDLSPPPEGTLPDPKPEPATSPKARRSATVEE